MHDAAVFMERLFQLMIQYRSFLFKTIDHLMMQFCLLFYVNLFYVNLFNAPVSFADAKYFLHVIC